jgi:BNR repeat protein
MLVHASHYHLWLRLVMLSALLPASAWGGQTANPALFSRTKMQEVELKGLRVWLGKPVQVTAQVGWQQSGPWYDTHGSNGEPANARGASSWAFIHLTPFMARFPSGELIVTYTLDSDTDSNPVTVSGFQISKDGGEHWGRRYSLLMQHMTMTFVPKAPDSLLGLPSEMVQQSPGDEHNYRGPYYLFEQGGERMVMVPDGIRALNFPWPAYLWRSPQPREDWPVGARITGSTIEIGGRLLGTGDLEKKGDKLWSAILWTSEDGGYTWRYFSTVAEPDRSLASQRSYEGPTEPNVMQLADGDLMAVFRVGSGRRWNLGRAYSHDGGHTWTKPDVLPAWSVSPQIKRIANGTIVLSTGRPGIHLWLSNDPRGTTWQDIDIVAYHNRWAPTPTERISSFEIKSSPYLSETTQWQTSSYTGLVEVAPNRLLLAYDRDPERAPSGPDDLSRVFVLPIEVERK